MAATSTSTLDGLARTSGRLFDDCLLPPETVKIRDEARQFAERVLAPRASELNSAEESSAVFPRDILRQMADAGLYAIPFSADVGGRALQYPMLGAATVLEELAYFTPAVASALYDAQALLVGRTLDGAPASIRREFLPRLVRGEIVGSFATSKPDASTDLSAAAMRTTAVPVPGGFRLSGRKRWITNACAADIMTVLCVVDGAQAMLLVDMHADGVAVPNGGGGPRSTRIHGGGSMTNQVPRKGEKSNVRHRTELDRRRMANVRNHFHIAQSGERRGGRAVRRRRRGRGRRGDHGGSPGLPHYELEPRPGTAAPGPQRARRSFCRPC
jgi:Acyl-CoA dehydrogenase, N-terminal domain/Acyl-CoA dehydrogenase, middle domain